jgi:hypothetical protein
LTGEAVSSPATIVICSSEWGRRDLSFAASIAAPRYQQGPIALGGVDDTSFFQVAIFISGRQLEKSLRDSIIY